MKSFRFIFLILLIFCFLIPLNALEIKEGRLKLVLHENIGRFSAYYLEDVRKNKYTSLFLDQDPRTSLLSVLIDNTVYRMGETSGFTEKVEKTVNGGKFIWESPFVRVTEDFSFVNAPGETLPTGVVIKISVTNISEQDYSAGVRYLFDTFLGERDNIHFKTETLSDVTNERSFSSTSMPDYFLSQGKKETDTGFQIMTDSDGITKPDRVILANWKRLNDNSWAYEVNSSRNFNQLPYSINDSAIALYYNPSRVLKKQTKTVTIIIGSYNKNGYTLETSATSTEIAKLFNQTVNETDTQFTDPNLAIQSDLIAVRDLIEKIDAKLESGEKITDSDISVMEQVISELQKRKTRYETE